MYNNLFVHEGSRSQLHDCALGALSLFLMLCAGERRHIFFEVCLVFVYVRVQDNHAETRRISKWLNKVCWTLNSLPLVWMCVWGHVVSVGRQPSSNNSKLSKHASVPVPLLENASEYSLHRM